MHPLEAIYTTSWIGTEADAMRNPWHYAALLSFLAALAATPAQAGLASNPSRLADTLFVYLGFEVAGDAFPVVDGLLHEVEVPGVVLDFVDPATGQTTNRLIFDPYTIMLRQDSPQARLALRPSAEQSALGSDWFYAVNARFSSSFHGDRLQLDWFDVFVNGTLERPASGDVHSKVLDQMSQTAFEIPASSFDLIDRMGGVRDQLDIGAIHLVVLPYLSGDGLSLDSDVPEGYLHREWLQNAVYPVDYSVVVNSDGVPVPEPSSVRLLGGGGVAILLARWHSRCRGRTSRE